MAKLLWLAAWLVVPAALAQEPPSGGAGLTDSESPRLSEQQRDRVELKRQDTSRGTPGESTQTTLRLERLFNAPVDLLRLDLPFPDEKTDYAGSPFDPRMGDIKVRARFRAVRSSSVAFSPFVEATFPTAADDLGTGKYQLSAGLRMISRVVPPFLDSRNHRLQFEAQVQQVDSVAGDPNRKDINATKFELTLYDLWLGKYTAKLKLKPNVDWVQDGTGTVAEVEGGLFFARYWRTWLMMGHRVSGPSGIQGTYDTRVELGLSRTY